MAGFAEKNGVLHVDEVPLTEIARLAGTPTYVYSAGVIRSQYEKLAGAMRPALPAGREPLLCYACKANSNIAVLKVLQKLGSSIEVVSEGELIRAQEAGFDPAKIVSEGVGKSESAIAAGLKAGIHQFNVESLSELSHIERIAGEMGKTAHVVFRLNPDVGGAAHSKITTGRKHDKFGLSPENVAKGFAAARNMKHVKAVGLFTHIGSQIHSAAPFKELFEKIAAFTKEMRAEGHTIERLDIGGGFPIAYREDEELLDLKAYAALVRDIIAPLETEIILEPGRFMVGNAGALLTRALYIKEAEEKTFLVLDAAMNDLIRPAMYDAWHDIEPVENRSAAKKTYDIVGPVCESSDIFAKDRPLPEMKEGDLAVLRSAGAYGFCMASNYNTRPLPAEILVDGNQHAIIRKRQSYEDIIGQETIPDWLT